MKTYIFILLSFVTLTVFSQNSRIVNTEDGKRVLLKPDYTWEYIDTDSSSIALAPKPKENTTCNLTENFNEPKLDKKIQAQLKRGRASISYVKKKVAKDNNCNVKQVVLLSVSEHKSKAVYHFCANGKRVTYKRIGNTIIKKEQFF